MERVRIGRRGLSVAVLSMAVLALTQTASGAPPPLVPVAPPTGPLPNKPGQQFHSFTDNGAYISTLGTVTKAKTKVLFPLTLGHAYTDFAVTVPPNSHIQINADIYFVSPAGIAQRYGYLPPARVTVLAFGSIPVTATVQLVQPLLSTGYLDPIHASQDFVNTGGTNATTYVTGRLQVKLSDVTVDQVPLDVGSNCSADSDLSLVGHAPEYQSPTSGGPLAGTIDIGTFSGCGATENLSPLISAMVSGKGNPVKANQGKLGIWVYPQSCPPVTDPNNIGDTGCGIPVPPQ